MPISLPGSNQADIAYTTNLEGQGYDIRLRWNNRSESWFMYIGLMGVRPSLKTRLTTNTDLLASYRGSFGVPPGSLYLLDLEKGFGRPSFDNFGINRRFELIYIRSTEANPFDQIQ